MISKNEFLYAKKKKDELAWKITEYYAHSETHKYWELWNTYSADQQQKIKNEWNEYYKAVWNSPQGMAYSDCKNALKHRDISKVKFIVSSLSSLPKNTITQPSFPDPDLLKEKNDEHKKLENMQKIYENLYDEYKAVYESRSSQATL